MRKAKCEDLITLLGGCMHVHNQEGGGYHGALGYPDVGRISNMSSSLHCAHFNNCLCYTQVLH